MFPSLFANNQKRTVDKVCNVENVIELIYSDGLIPTKSDSQ